MKKLDGITDVFKHTKRRHPTAIFCPKCCSPNLQLSSSLDVWLTPKQYYCSKCGYHGIIVMELEPEEQNNECNQNEAITEDKQKEKTSDTA